MNNNAQESVPNIVNFAETYQVSRPRDTAPAVATAPADHRHRLMLISRPGLVGECLGRMLADGGFDAVLQPLGEPIRQLSIAPALAILCLNQVDPGLLIAARQRIDELHGLAHSTPIMAMVGEAHRSELRDLAQLGIGATLVGLPSIDIAVAAIRFAIIGGPCVTAEIRLRLDTIVGDAAPRAADRDARDGDRSGEDHDCRFTPREAAVLQLLRQGQQNKVIAHTLAISESTVKVHLRAIMAKLRVTNRTQIVCSLGVRQDDPTRSAHAT